MDSGKNAETIQLGRVDDLADLEIDGHAADDVRVSRLSPRSVARWSIM